MNPNMIGPLSRVFRTERTPTAEGDYLAIYREDDTQILDWSQVKGKAPSQDAILAALILAFGEEKINTFQYLSPGRYLLRAQGSEPLIDGESFKAAGETGRVKQAPPIRVKLRDQFVEVYLTHVPPEVDNETIMEALHKCSPTMSIQSIERIKHKTPLKKINTGTRRISVKETELKFIPNKIRILSFLCYTWYRGCENDRHCAKCGQVGHLLKKCPLKNLQGEKTYATAVSGEKSAETEMDTATQQEEAHGTEESQSIISGPGAAQSNVPEGSMTPTQDPGWSSVLRGALNITPSSSTGGDYFSDFGIYREYNPYDLLPREEVGIEDTSTETEEKLSDDDKEDSKEREARRERKVRKRRDKKERDLQEQARKIQEMYKSCGLDTSPSPPPVSLSVPGNKGTPETGEGEPAGPPLPDNEVIPPKAKDTPPPPIVVEEEEITLDSSPPPQEVEGEDLLLKKTPVDSDRPEKNAPPPPIVVEEEDLFSQDNTPPPKLIIVEEEEEITLEMNDPPQPKDVEEEDTIPETQEGGPSPPPNDVEGGEIISDEEEKEGVQILNPVLTPSKQEELYGAEADKDFDAPFSPHGTPNKPIRVKKRKTQEVLREQSRSPRKRHPSLPQAKGAVASLKEKFA